MSDADTAQAAPEPWASEPEETGVVLFWVLQRAQLDDIVRDSLALGNDRIGLIVLSNASEPGWLVRIESPSWFLIERCREAAEVAMYYPARETLFVQWGFAHPHAKRLWSHTNDWTFLSHDGAVRTVAETRWLDAYDTTDFELRPPPELMQFVGDSDPELTITVALRARRRHHPAEPELWLLDDEQALQDQLGELDEEDIAELLLSVQDDTSGARRYLVRQKHGRGGCALHLRGQAFARYKGFHNLMLPIDWELAPQLRRDGYRRVFELQPDELTLVDIQETGSQVFRLSEHSFVPAGDFVDYLITARAESLQTVLARTVFDLGDYVTSRAPVAKELKGTRKPERSPAPPTKPSTPGAGATNTRSASRAPTESVVIAPEPTRDPDTEELQLERRVIRDGQSLELWMALLDVKEQQDRWEHAFECGVQALWLTTDEEMAAPLRERIAAHAEQLPDADEHHQVVSRVFDGSERTHEERWIRDTSARLQASEGTLTHKLRWLLWREVLLQNRDEREVTRVRDGILNSLDHAGLTDADVPRFIQDRFLRERFLGDEDTESLEELNAATTNLHVLERLTTMPEHLSVPFSAILAHGKSRLQRAQRAEVCGEVESMLAGVPAPSQARALLYLVQASRDSSDEDRLRQRYDEAFAAVVEPRLREELEKLEQSLNQREQEESPAEFLAQRNKHELYATHTASADGPLAAERELLSSDYRGGRLEDAVKQAVSILDGLAKELGTSGDAQDVSRALVDLVEILAKLRHHAQGSEILDALLGLADALDDLPIPPGGLYGQLLRLGLADALVRLGHPRWRALTLGVIRMTSYGPPLDLLDVYMTAIEIIERSALSDRFELLSALVDSLDKVTNGGQVNWLEEEGPVYIGKMVALVDQAAEAAMSKDKLTLASYRRYRDQDELLIRERLWMEDLK